MKNSFDILIIGGGAAGFFTAINAASFNPNVSIGILEKNKEVLTKVKISGGGRCNVTHAAFIPKELSKKYPRGQKELLGPFHQFMTGDTIAWFEERGVLLKIEEDGRMFPETNTSQTIIDCFLNEITKHRITLCTRQGVVKIVPKSNSFEIHTKTDQFVAKKLVLATGSSPKVWSLLSGLGHTIIPPVPSLFTFNIEDTRIKELSGLSTEASVQIIDDKKLLLQEEGPLLITHWGMSGPAILKLSAWGARMLAPMDYQFTIRVNWLLDISTSETLDTLLVQKKEIPKQTLYKNTTLDIPKRLWQRLVIAAGIPATKIWADVSKNELLQLALQLTQGEFQVTGKSTFKEEFVTAGGVDLKEINFKTFESKVIPNLYLAGEVLNIDAITGGFNFQNAWTSGYLVAQSITQD